MSARGAALAYIAAVNAGDADRLMALFSDDAVMQHPTGEHAGIAKLREFYEGLILASRTELQAGRIVADEVDRVAMFELTASSPLDDHTNLLHAVDVLDCDDTGRIVRLAVYYATT